MKLASIEKILKIEDIPNADRIQLATVQGWQSVCIKNQFKEGDSIIFVPIDTVIQRAVWNEFLFSDKNSLEIRLKTKKLRGVYSQGVIFSLSAIGNALEGAVEGDDVGERLSVTKYEKAVPNAQSARGGLPSFLRKSDEENLQSSPACFDELKASHRVFASLKMDGSSFKAYLKGDEFGVCSRSLDLKDEAGNKFWDAARSLDLENKMRKLGLNLCICGELCGPGIQKNPMGLTSPTLFVYDIWSIDGQFYYNQMARYSYAEILGLKMTPSIKIGSDHYFSEFQFADMKEALAFVNAQKYANGKPAEGIVFRGEGKDCKDIFSPTLRGRLSVKLINQNYVD